MNTWHLILVGWELLLVIYANSSALRDAYLGNWSLATWKFATASFALSCVFTHLERYI